MDPRNDGRKPASASRSDRGDPSFLEQPHGFVLWSRAKTRVPLHGVGTCGVPRWLPSLRSRLDDRRNTHCCPRRTGERTDASSARQAGGRTVEINV